jgi:hypothetical protein
VSTVRVDTPTGELETLLDRAGHAELPVLHAEGHVREFITAPSSRRPLAFTARGNPG